ncbi:pyridoxamine 5'-phosphate oxidase family protein [Treponema brennaborense]|uniref:Pyridoxamine 5'-phosphate oxidase-related FMN-binding protein n=1 Tax=Treponema brennaborense (strain DSM 12168 / CIP 105900 / DD5/3) TaxID=906968 RepID=F4LKY8_TREBD|nr:pyridoxamine 5'-phosphate oxidase family protein [Treponema brennaborense]AEE16585.1 pyridoxamine 5'-phosphate oxidase-related FMN-binding protein [Treponema brennaborense DSM 12168]
MDIRDVVTIMKTSKAAVLSTVNESGYPESRALLNLANAKKYPKLADKAIRLTENTVTLYFTTNTSSRKITQLRANPKASLYFCIPDKFLGAGAVGEIEEITDETVKKEFWQTGWRIYYPKGYTDPDYTLLKFTSKKIRCWGGFAKHEFS